MYRDNDTNNSICVDYQVDTFVPGDILCFDVYLHQGNIMTRGWKTVEQEVGRSRFTGGSVEVIAIKICFVKLVIHIPRPCLLRCPSIRGF